MVGIDLRDSFNTYKCVDSGIFVSNNGGFFDIFREIYEILRKKIELYRKF